MAIMAQPKIHGYLDILNEFCTKIPQTTEVIVGNFLGLKSLCLYNLQNRFLPQFHLTGPPSFQPIFGVLRFNPYEHTDMFLKKRESRLPAEVVVQILRVKSWGKSATIKKTWIMGALRSLKTIGEIWKNLMTSTSWARNPYFYGILWPKMNGVTGGSGS